MTMPEAVVISTVVYVGGRLILEIIGGFMPEEVRKNDSK